ncbi:MAG: polyprenyl synthetase family protein [Anaerolineae bacterium]
MEAAGGRWQDALPAAAAVELLHNFSLVHDDIQDVSETRHNRPIIWKVWSEASRDQYRRCAHRAFLPAMSRLKETVEPEIVIACLEIFNHTNLELTRGQHLDLRFEKQAVVTVDEYLSMIRGKTAALVAGSAQLGALIGSKDVDKAARFAEYGLNSESLPNHDDILRHLGKP